MGCNATLGTDFFLSFYLHKAAGESLGHRSWRGGLRACDASFVILHVFVITK